MCHAAGRTIKSFICQHECILPHFLKNSTFSCGQLINSEQRGSKCLFLDSGFWFTILYLLVIAPSNTTVLITRRLLQTKKRRSIKLFVTVILQPKVLISRLRYNAYFYPSLFLFSIYLGWGVTKDLIVMEEWGF